MIVNNPSSGSCLSMIYSSILSIGLILIIILKYRTSTIHHVRISHKTRRILLSIRVITIVVELIMRYLCQNWIVNWKWTWHEWETLALVQMGLIEETTKLMISIITFYWLVNPRVRILITLILIVRKLEHFLCIKLFSSSFLFCFWSKLDIRNQFVYLITQKHSNYCQSIYNPNYYFMNSVHQIPPLLLQY